MVVTPTDLLDDGSFLSRQHVFSLDHLGAECRRVNLIELERRVKRQRESIADTNRLTSLPKAKGLQEQRQAFFKIWQRNFS